MLTYTPPAGTCGSLLQALYEAEAMVQALQQNMAKMVGESPQAIAGIAEAPPLSGVSNVNVQWGNDGRLFVSATTDSMPMSERPSEVE